MLRLLPALGELTGGLDLARGGTADGTNLSDRSLVRSCWSTSSSLVIGFLRYIGGSGFDKLETLTVDPLAELENVSFADTPDALDALRY